MVKQYPHTLTINNRPAANSTLSSDGRWASQTIGDPLTAKCRYEPASLVKELEVADGKVVKYKGIIYLPSKTPAVDNGTFVKIEGIVEGKVLYFNKGQLNCKIYI